MSYKVTSEFEVCGKTNGETITEKELFDAGANVEALIGSGHIQSTAPVSQLKSAVNEGVDK